MSIVKSLSTYTIFSMAEKALPFIIYTLYTFYLSQHQMGLLSNLDVIIQITTIFIALNVDKTLIVEFFKKNKKEDFDKLLWNSLLLVLSSFTLFASITLVIYLSEPSWLPLDKGLIFVIPITALAKALFNIITTLFQAQNAPLKFGLFSLLAILVQASIALALVIVFGLELYGVVLAYFVGSVILIVTSLFLIRKQLFLRIDKDELNYIFKLSLPLILVSAMNLTINSSDRLFITAFRGTDAVALYHMGYMIGSIVYLFNVIHSRAWTPLLFKYLKEQSAKADMIIARYTLAFYCAMVLIFLGVLMASELYFNHIIPPQYNKARIFTPIIALSYVLYSIYQSYSLVLLYEKQNTILSVISLVAIVTNIILNIILIKTLGTIGAAYSTLATFMILAALSYHYGKKHYTYQWKSALSFKK